MWWIIGGIIGLAVLIFLWLIVRNAAHGIDKDTQTLYDEEQSEYISQYFQDKDQKKQNKQKS